MKNYTTKPFLLVELLEKFTPTELKDLEALVACSYFNTDKHIITLLKVLKRKVLHKYQLKHDNLAELYRNVFGDLSASKSTLNKQQTNALRVKMSVLTRLAERFLVLENLQQKEATQTELLHEKLLEKEQIRLYERDNKKRRKQLDTQLKDLNYYEHKCKIEYSRLNYLYRTGEWIKEDNLPELTRSWDMYYLIHRLSLHLTELSFQEVSARPEYDFAAMEAVEALAATPPYHQIPQVQIYRVAIQLVKNKEDDTYTQLLDLLSLYRQEVPTHKLNDFYIVLVNFCISQIKRGQITYYRQLFDLYRIMDEQKMLLEDGLMTPGKLRNITSAACRVDEFEWANQFIEKYYPFTRKDVQNDIRNFNLGVVAFYQKKYTTAIDYLYDVAPIDLNYDLNRRMVLVKSHYEVEIEYKETTMQVFRSVEKYIQQNKLLTQSNKTAYKNFVRLLINLYRIRHRATKMTPQSLRNKLEKAKLLSDKRWLLEKVEELQRHS